MVLEIACPENFIFRTSQTNGRPLCERVNLARAFIAKAHWDIPTTRALVERLKVDRPIRNLCGWVLPGEIPSESTFSRAFAEFAESNIPRQIHKGIIYLGGKLIDRLYQVFYSIGKDQEASKWRKHQDSRTARA